MINSYCPHLIQICYMMHRRLKKKLPLWGSGSKREAWVKSESCAKKRVTRKYRVVAESHVIRIKNESHIKSDSHEQSESQAWGRTRGWLALRAQHPISSKAELGEKQASCISLFKWMAPGMAVVNTTWSDLHTMQSYLTSPMAHLAKAYLSFCRVKGLGALPPRPVFYQVSWGVHC